MNPKLAWVPTSWPLKNGNTLLLHYWQVQCSVYLDFLCILFLCFWSRWEAMQPHTPKQHQQQKKKKGWTCWPLSSFSVQGKWWLPTWLLFQCLSPQAPSLCRVLALPENKKCYVIHLGRHPLHLQHAVSIFIRNCDIMEVNQLPLQIHDYHQ